MKLNFRLLQLNFRLLQLNFRLLQLNFSLMQYNFRQVKFNFSKWNWISESLSANNFVAGTRFLPSQSRFQMSFKKGMGHSIFQIWKLLRQSKEKITKGSQLTDQPPSRKLTNKSMNKIRLNREKIKKKKQSQRNVFESIKQKIQPNDTTRSKV